MEDFGRFANKAIKRIDAANRDDPGTELVDGKPSSRELLFAQRVYDWVRKLVNDPSEELLLAAPAHPVKSCDSFWRLRDHVAERILQRYRRHRYV